MDRNEQLIQAITKAVVEQWKKNGAQAETAAPLTGTQSLAGKTRMRPKRSYEGAVKAEKGTDPKEIVIGVGAAFQT